MISKYIFSFYLMLISPMLALFFGLREKSFAYKRGLLVLAITIFGSIILITEGVDGFVHHQNVYNHYLDLSSNQFFRELIAILTFAPYPETNDDVYIHVLSYFVGSILEVPQLFFVIVSFIYAYFFSGSILKVLQVIPQTKISYFFYIFSTVFVLYKNVEGINTVRTWTGLWILFYAAFCYFETRKLKYLFLMFIPPFVHVAYFIMAVPTWIITLFGSRFKLIYAGVFVMSFFYGINKNVAMETLSGSEVGANKSQAYYVEDVENHKVRKYDDSTWYRQMQKGGVQKYALYLVAFTLIFSGIYFNGMNTLESKLFSIGILTKTLSNFSTFIFALSARSALIGSIFIIAAFLLLLKRGYFNKEKINYFYIYQTLFFISAILYVPYLVYKIADLISFISVFMLMFPFIPWIFNDINISIRGFIGQFL